MSADQARLLDPGPATGHLRPRQEIVFAYLQANWEGERAIDIGRHLHRELGRRCACSETVWCGNAKAEALEVLRSLGTNQREIVKYRRSLDKWQSLVRPPAPVEEWPADFF